jgi:DoxX-like family
VQTMAIVGFPQDKLWFLASAEFAGAVGLVGGLFWAPLGVAAAVGVILYFVGAVGSHLRVRDFKGIAPAAALLLVAVATLALRVATIGR